MIRLKKVIDYLYKSMPIVFSLGDSELDLEPLSANSFAEMPSTVFVVEGYPVSDSDKRLGVIDISGDKLVVYATESDPTEFLAKFSRDGSTKELVVENVGGGLKDWFRKTRDAMKRRFSRKKGKKPYGNYSFNEASNLNNNNNSSNNEGTEMTTYSNSSNNKKNDPFFD